MKKKLLLAAFAVTIAFTACSTDTSRPESPKTDLQINLVEQMDATGIEYMEPHGNRVYIIGAKRDKSKPQRELIYAICDLDTEKVEVIYRDFSPIDGAWNMSVYQDDTGKDTVFTGQKILTAKDAKLLSSQDLNEEYKREAYLDLANNQIVFVGEDDLNLYFRALNDSDDIQSRIIYASSTITDENGDARTLFPYHPKFNDRGDKILFGVAIDEASFYQNVILCDTGGEILAQTDTLPIYADFLDFLWYHDGFFTLEITDAFDGTPSGHATIFTRYDAECRQTGRTVLECVALSCQRRVYPDTDLYAFGYEKDGVTGLALYDIGQDRVSSVYETENYIVSPTVSPDGERVLWVENGMLIVKDVASLVDSQAIDMISEGS
ncbi:MAG TPA: hypothetical protein PKI76_01655 [Oscillospiraceae bacterium]|nr:hypothetical protein [Oscillospiraceae bacterium]HNW04075.1 hypothetical protein [Oscillospiraceae bacterium]